MTPSRKNKVSKETQSQKGEISFDLKPNSKVQITIETGKLSSGKIPVTIQMDQVAKKNTKKHKSPWTGLNYFDVWLKKYNLADWLFILAIGIYLLTRLIGLTHFPIYFFTDEAIQTQSIVDLISNGFRDGNKVFLPPYFRNGDYANLSLSVYLQWIPFILFGKSAFVTRATSVIVTLIAAISVGVVLRDVFKNKYWWAGTLFLSITPAWFFHSRTAFETAEFTAFFAGTLCAYLLYRYKSPRYLFLTLILAAFSFYTYSPGQLIVPLTAMALFISDWRYHWENRQTVIKGLVLVIFMAIPYIRYRIEYPGVTYSHLYTLGSYLVEEIPVSEKIARYFSEYGIGLSASYWYLPNDRDLQRHVMKDYGHIMIATLPFAILGLTKILSNLRDSSNRVVLISLMVAPVSTALVMTGITRALAFVIPVAILTTIGLEQAICWVENPAKRIMEISARSKQSKNQIINLVVILLSGSLAAYFVENQIDRIVILAITVIFVLQKSRLFEDLFNRFEVPKRIKKSGLWTVPQTMLALIVFGVLSLANFFMLNDSLRNGPLWFRDYGLGGMQYGGFQIFDIIEQYRLDHPAAEVILSPSWANGTDMVARFFLNDPLPFKIGSIVGNIDQKIPINDGAVFVMTPDEYKLIKANPKFVDVNVERTVPYPDGTPGFYFIRLRYADNIDEIFAEEKALRDVLRESVVSIDGQDVKIRFSYLDAGEQEEAQQEAIKKVFDKDILSLAKTFEANPFVIEMAFSSPRVINGFSIVTGSASAQITLKCYPNVDAQPLIYTFKGQGSITQPELSFNLPQSTQVQILRVEMFDPTTLPPTKIHIWELVLR